MFWRGVIESLPPHNPQLLTPVNYNAHSVPPLSDGRRGVSLSTSTIDGLLSLRCRGGDSARVGGSPLPHLPAAHAGCGPVFMSGRPAVLSARLMAPGPPVAGTLFWPPPAGRPTRRRPPLRSPIPIPQSLMGRFLPAAAAAGRTAKNRARERLRPDRARLVMTVLLWRQQVLSDDAQPLPTLAPPFEKNKASLCCGGSDR